MPLYFNNVALLRGTGNTLASDQACCCKGGGGKRCECVRDRLTGMQVEFQGKTFTAEEIIFNSKYITILQANKWK